MVIGECQLVLFQVNGGDSASYQLAEQYLFRQRVADFLHDQAPQRPGPVIGVIAFSGESVPGTALQANTDFFFGELCFKLNDQLIDNAFHRVDIE